MTIDGYRCDAIHGFERGAALEAGDERVARLGAGVAHDVPEPLRVDDEARTAVERQPHLGGGIGKAVGTLLHEDHEAVGVVGELESTSARPNRRRRD